METKKETFILTGVGGKTKNNKADLLQYVGEMCEIETSDNELVLYVHDREIARYINPNINIININKSVNMRINDRIIQLIGYNETSYYPSTLAVCNLERQRTMRGRIMSYYNVLLLNRTMLKNAGLVDSDEQLNYYNIGFQGIFTELNHLYLRLSDTNNIDDLYVYDVETNSIRNVWLNTVCIYNVSGIRVYDGSVSILDNNGRYIKFNIFNGDIKVISKTKISTNNIKSPTNFIGNIKQLSLSRDMSSIYFSIASAYEPINKNIEIHHMYMSNGNIHVTMRGEEYIFTLSKKCIPQGMYCNTSISIDDAYNWDNNLKRQEIYRDVNTKPFKCSECGSQLEYDNEKIICSKCKTQYNIHINLKDLSYNIDKMDY